jgi:hypothetical protein
MMGRRGRSRMKRRGLSRFISSNAIQKNEGFALLAVDIFLREAWYKDCQSQEEKKRKAKLVIYRYEGDIFLRF